MRSERRFRPDLEAPREARRFVERTLGREVGERWLETATLLVSELVTNAVMHTDTDVVVAIDRADGRVVVSVTDRDPGSAEAVTPRRGRGTSDPTGRGLQIVDALADRWGVETSDTTKVVWFELALPDGAPTAAAT